MLPRYKTFDLQPVHIQGASTNVTLVVFSPGSLPATTAFFDAFADLVERLTAHAASIFIVGDLHLDNQAASSTISFLGILSGADLVQLVKGPTHPTDTCWTSSSRKATR